MPRDGRYRFQVIGGAPGTPGRHALFVDGARDQLVQYTADLALNATSRWQYRGSAEVVVELTAGQHVLSLRASEDGVNRLPNSDITLDKFVLTDVSDGEPTVYPASTLRYDGGAGVRYDSLLTRGFGAISGDQRADVYANAWESGYYDVVLDYATEGAAAIDVSVNGRSVASLAAEASGAWRSTARLHLSQGINEIELRSAEGVLLGQVTTVRAAEGDGSATTIEAESATLAGAASVFQLSAGSGTNASGSAKVGYLGNGAGNTLTVQRQAAFSEPGEYDIVVHYANAELSGRHDYNPQVVDRRLVVTEEGSPETSAAKYFRYTYSWDSFWERTIPITLTTADGALTFGNPTAYAPDVDKITIAPVLLGTPTTIATGPAEADLTAQSRGGVSVRGSAVQGTPVRVTLPAEYVGGDVAAYLFPAPGAVGEYTVDEEEGFVFTLPADALGEHKVAVYAGDGTLIGWDDLKVRTRGGGNG